MRLPLTYVILLGTAALFGLVFGLVSFNVISLPGIYFAITNVVLLTLLLVFAVLGGAFVGMLFTHRMLTNREFSPMERTIMQTHAEVRELSKRLVNVERHLAGSPDERPTEEPPEP